MRHTQPGPLQRPDRPGAVLGAFGGMTKWDGAGPEQWAMLKVVVQDKERSLEDSLDRLAELKAGMAAVLGL